MRTVMLNEGDAIRTKGLTDDEYHEVAKAFLSSGFCRGEPRKMIVAYRVVSRDNFESLKNNSDDLDKMDGQILDIDDPDVVMYDTEKNAFDHIEQRLYTARETSSEKPAFVVVIDNEITIIHREVKFIRHTA